MRSHKQLDANRKNAKSSTGPKTQTGKKHARLNALKHGFYAKEIIINQKYRADVEKILGDYYAEKMPRTALQRVAVKEIAFCSWTCELAARLTVHHFNTLLEPDGEPEPPTSTKETPEVVEFFGSSRQALRNGIAFLDRLRLEVEEHGGVPEDLKDSVRTVFGERFLELLKQPQSEVSRDGLLLAHQLHSHAKIFNRPLPSPPREGREFMVDPEQSKQIDTQANRAAAGISRKPAGDRRQGPVERRPSRRERRSLALFCKRDTCAASRCRLVPIPGRQRLVEWYRDCVGARRRREPRPSLVLSGREFFPDAVLNPRKGERRMLQLAE